MIETAAERPLVTFALFSYNQEDFVEAAVRGAFAQTYSPMEIILSDDASPDGTYAKMEALAAEYDGPHRVVLNCNEENMGIGAHVRKVYGMAKGEWLASTAADDISMPDRIEKMMAAAAAAGDDTVGMASGWIDMSESGEDLENQSVPTGWHARQMKEEWPRGIEACRNALVDGMNVVPGCTSMWKTDLVTDWPEWPADLAYEDVALSCRAHLTGRIELIGEKLVRYRQSPNAMVNQGPAGRSAKARLTKLRKNRERNFERLACYRAFFADVDFMVKEGRLELTERDKELLAEIQEVHDRKTAAYHWARLPLHKRVRGFLKGGKDFPFTHRGLKRVMQILPRTWLDWIAVMRSD